MNESSINNPNKEVKLNNENHQTTYKGHKENKEHNDLDSELNPNYVKQSFDKLIYLYSHIEYQKLYLNEIEKKPIEKSFEKTKISYSNEEDSKPSLLLRKKRKMKANNSEGRNKNSKNNQEKNKIKNIFCNNKCFDKFQLFLNNFDNECLSDRNKKVLEIVDFIITENSTDRKRFNRFYEFIKNECK